MANQLKPKVFGLMAYSPSQFELIKQHCFGDCGKMGLFDYVNTDLGPLCICRIETCPHLKNELHEPFGETEHNGDVVYLRAIK